MEYYIAYGSNLCKRQMAYRCPDAKALGTGFLEGYELLFKGSRTGAYLTVEKKKGCRVPVGIWSISESDKASLDRYEGCPAFYYKKQMQIAFKESGTKEEKSVNALIYIMHEDRKLGIPSSYYVDVCAEGYKDFGIDESYLDNAYVASAFPKCPK